MGRFVGVLLLAVVPTACVTTVQSVCTDCDGNDCSAFTSYHADSICDSGCGEVNFNCETWNFDGGDCIGIAVPNCTTCLLYTSDAADE